MLYQVSFEKNTVCQCRLIDAPSADTARAYFEENEPTTTLYGVSEHSGMIKPGMPVDRVPDDWKSADGAEAKKGNPVEHIRETIENKPARSAWDNGVKVYALELLENLEEGINGGYIDPEDLESPALLKKALLNGAADWSQYSWSGCSLCYDCQIAKRLCTSSELKRKRGGDLQPNSRETWLDVQARALYQAARWIINAARA